MHKKSKTFLAKQRLGGSMNKINVTTNNNFIIKKDKLESKKLIVIFYNINCTAIKVTTTQKESVAPL